MEITDHTLPVKTMASSGEAQESNLPPCLRNKNLYVGVARNTMIVTIKIEDQLELVGKEEAAIIENAVILGEWGGIHNYDGLPLAMRIFVKDSKVYATGGANHDRNNKPCHLLSRCLKQSSPSMLVYEFSNDSRPRFSPCSSVPQLPFGMSFPFIVNHMGEIYVLYGQHLYDRSWLPENDISVLEKCFLVLRKDGVSWESLPHPPPLDDFALWSSMWFYGAFGNMLYVCAGRQLFGYHVKKKLWKETSWHPWIVERSITLSSLSTETSYAVIYVLYHDEVEGHEICAALVDEDGQPVQTQVIHEAKGCYDRIGIVKLIELESDNDSNTFAVVFTAGSNMIGLTVVRVSLCSPFGKEMEDHVTKLPKLHREDDFLRAEILIEYYRPLSGLLDRLIMSGNRVGTDDLIEYRRNELLGVGFNSMVGSWR
ncbi:hypothetical protein LINGRAHAP2_LOCUS18724 [Linum grandiflorum]